MWVFFCLPWPNLLCEESFLSLVHMFYVVTITQAIIIYCGKCPVNIIELGYHDCLITDIYKFMREYGVTNHYFISNYIDSSCDIEDVIRSLSFPYLRRCALLWKVINSSTPAPFSYGDHVLERSSNAVDDKMGYANGILEELVKDVVRDDPTNNVPDLIFSKLGMQLHRRDQHPLGILKNAIFDYFDTNFPNKFDKFDDVCPLVSTK